MNSEQHPESEPIVDEQARARAFERHQALATGLLALPNLFLRSVGTLVLLYGILTLALVVIVQLGYLGPELALIIGIVFAGLQFALGPFLMDLCLRWLYTMRWVEPEELPEHLRSFVERVCEQERMRFPSFGIIDDGAPQAFTYGHHPSNARIVISRGLMTLLKDDELEAVVAHEIGHARNWDMALMTLANLVPLLLYYLYRVGIRVSEGDNKGKTPAWAVALGAYVLYVISEYIVLWFSRTREYYADRFAGQATGNPNALARALIVIAYGLASQDMQEHIAEEEEKKSDKKKTAKREVAGAGALGALNIFNRNAAVSMVMSATRTKEGNTLSGIDIERAKGAMQWDLWNPWAGWYELNSTHPLVAKRLNYLGDQAAAMDQQPLVVFDRAKPESYWDEFFVDLFVMMLPLLGFLTGLALFLATGLGMGQWQLAWLGVGVALMGLGGVCKTYFKYPRGLFPHLTVAALMGHVKVSPVRPVPVTMTGAIIGKGVPGLIWSEDFVIQDSTGILFLDYQQPLGLWNWLFGLLRAGSYQGKEVRVEGWFRRAPTPYLEINRLEVIDGSLPSRKCYTSWASLFGYVFLTVLGIVGAAAAWVAF